MNRNLSEFNIYNNYIHISKIFAQTNLEVKFMSKNSKKDTKDKLKSGPSTTESLGNSTDANLTIASSGPKGDDSHDLFMHFKSDKKHI